MSSRFVRKTLGRTSQDDLAQVLQKVGLDKNHNDSAEDDDDGSDLITASSNGRRNMFVMLADDDDQDEEKQDEVKDHESPDEEQPKPKATSKSKRKNKQKKKTAQNKKIEEIDDFLLVSNENQPGTPEATAIETPSDLFAVDNRLLNPLNEMKKKFGSAIVEQIERENNPTLQGMLSNLPSQRRRAILASQQQRPTTRAAKQNSFIFHKLGWPHYIKFGLAMKASAPLSENSRNSGNYFRFEFDKNYERLEIEYLNFVDSHDLQGIMDIIRQYPYHVGALLHLSDVSRMQDDTSTAVDLIERALYSFQQTFHPLFSITRGECRLEYRVQENRSFFVALFKHIIFSGERGCPRTALEFCKVLLSLNPNEDPLAILLLIDYFAIRCDEYNYLIRFHTEQNQRLNLNGLPNFAFSVALAHFRKQLNEQANEMLQDALLRFPSILKYLTDKLSIRPDRNVENCSFFMKNDQQESDALKCVQQLYVARIANDWKERDELEFLRINANQVVRIVNENQDPRIRDYADLRRNSYRRTPINICRHILLSESKEIHGFLPSNLENGRTFYSFDPFPPEDSIAGFTRPPRPQMVLNNNHNRFGMMIRSLFPNFNLDDYLVPMNNQGGAAAAAANDDLAQQNFGMLQALQENIRNFIQDIGINNIGDENPQQQNENDDEHFNGDEFD